jgi:hypothetical protein
MKVMGHRAMGPALSNEEGDHNATRSASNSSSTNASPEIITVSHSISLASPRSANSGCRFALCSRPRLLPFLWLPLLAPTRSFDRARIAATSISTAIRALPDQELIDLSGKVGGNPPLVIGRPHILEQLELELSTTETRALEQPAEADPKDADEPEAPDEPDV